MIQEYNTSNITSTSSDFTSTGFTIETNASMFKLLTSNIYQDTISAVIREWSCNAVDACVAASSPVSFDVHLPTDTALHLSVRDYGIGLTQDELVGLFCTLGASTKRTSNKFTGCLGIGRMAALAYATSFTVQSFHEGQSHSYLISIANGVPTSLHLGSEPSDQPSGLLLTMPVEPKDVNRFYSKAKSLYRYFEHKPNLNIELDIAFPSGDLVFTDWFIDPTAPSTYSNYLLMSNVLYEVRHSDLDTHGFERVVLRADNGSVTINPGRESLSYDQRTIDYLNTRFKEVLTEYKDFTLAAIDEQETDFDRLKLLNTSISNIPNKLREPIAKAFQSKYPSISSIFDFCYRWSTSIHLAKCPPNISLKTIHSGYTTPKDVSREDFTLSTVCKATFILVDQATNFSHAYSQVDGHRVVLSRPTGIKLDDFISLAESWLNSLGIPFVRSSSFARNTVSNTENRTADIYISDVYSTASVSKSYEYDGTTSYAYVELSGSSFVDDPSTIKAIITAYGIAYNQPVKPLKLVGVPKKYLAAVQSNSNFTPALDYFKSLLAPLQFILLQSSNIHPSNLPIDLPPMLATMKAELNAYKAVPAHLKLHQHAVDDLGAIIPVSCSTFQFTYTKEDIDNRYPHYSTILSCYGLSSTDQKRLLQDYLTLQEHYHDTTCQTSEQAGPNTDS